MKKFFVIPVLLMMVMFTTGCAQTDSPASPESMEKKKADKNIVEIASSNPDFSYLVQAVVFAELADALSSNRQLTVFAPVNSAFEQLASDLGYNNVGELLVPANKELVTKVLLYHVAPGEKYAKNVLAAGKTNTLAEQFAYIKMMNNEPYIGNDTKYAKIINTDIPAKNGVIHVIDKVILPQ